MSTLPQPGDTYGKFRITRQLGHGGMGIVYEATDTVLDRQVALKIVQPALVGMADYKARFAREAAVLARVRSRHIVPIHEYGEQDGTLFLVTELFPDGDLHGWLGSYGPQTPYDALGLIAQVCEGLADSHAAGVVHRDIKPSNVLVWDRNDQLIPYLCDFGIATNGESGLTQTGSVIGSFGYMAPERHVGQPADERSDLYSVGCLLWTLVTGQPPYAGTDFQVMNAHINEPVPQLSGGEDAAAVNAVLNALMAKDPAHRVPTARDALALIQQVLAAPQVPPGAPPSAPLPPLPPTVVRAVPPPPPPPAGDPVAPPPWGQQTVVRTPGPPPPGDLDAIQLMSAMRQAEEEAETSRDDRPPADQLRLQAAFVIVISFAVIALIATLITTLKR